MGKELRWDLPKILPCRKCIPRIFSKPELYHLSCNAETNETRCDYCVSHGFHCMHLPSSLVGMCGDLYELRKWFFASDTAMSRAAALIGLDYQVKKFIKELNKIEEQEYEKWNKMKVDADRGEAEGSKDSSEGTLKDDSIVDLMPERADQLVNSILKDMEKLFDEWKKIESAYGKIEHIVGEVKELKGILEEDEGEDDEEGEEDDAMEAD